MKFILALYKMCNITNSITQPQYYIFAYNELWKFRYDDYLGNYSFILLLYVVNVNIYLGKQGDFFMFKWKILDVLPLYSNFIFNNIIIF